MTSITDIDILSSTSEATLSKDILTAIKRGWEMYGMLSTAASLTSASGSGYDRVTYSQMMVKRTKTEDPKP